MSETAPIRFFLGSNSPQGFVSRFDQLDYGDPQWHTFYIFLYEAACRCI